VRSSHTEPEKSNGAAAGGGQSCPAPGRAAVAGRDGATTHIIACATVIAEMALPPEVGCHILDFGLHTNPNRLRETLQATIEEVVAATPSRDLEPLTIVLGYGLCSQGVVGLRAEGCRLVVPRVDDCIAIFLGSRAAYRQQSAAYPGTYYLTRGWIEVGSTPFAEFDRAVERFGAERAGLLYREMLSNYTRLALIDTGSYALESAREYALRTAQSFGLRYEEISGSTELITKLVHGPWRSDEFVVCEPGEVIGLDDFYRVPPACPPT